MPRIISFVIPCYGSENTISAVIAEIVATVKETDEYEIICVNDNSPDDVLSVLRTEAERNEHVKVISFSMNFGQHNALMAGYRESVGDVVVSLDDDGQTPACDSYKLIDALDEDHDVIFARYANKQHNSFRNLGSRFASHMGHAMMNAPKDLYGSSFFACKRYVIDEISNYENPYTFIAGLIYRSTDKLGNVDIVHRSRTQGESGYSLKKLISLWLNGFTSFSVKPLRAASVVGFIIAAAGIIYAIVIIVRKLVIPDIAIGYSSMMAALLFIGGMIMIMLGMLGEYVGRAYLSLNKAPQYVIKETMNIDSEKEQRD